MRSRDLFGVPVVFVGRGFCACCHVLTDGVSRQYHLDELVSISRRCFDCATGDCDLCA